MARRQSWIYQSTDVFLDELGNFGLVASRSSIAEVVSGRLAAVASGLGISEQSARRYVSEEVLRELARETAVLLAEEQPGSDLGNLPLTIPAPLAILGRAIAALAEAGHVRVQNDDLVGAHGALQLISLFGQIISEHPGSPAETVYLPRAALIRASRVLEATAAMIRAGEAAVPDIPAYSAVSLAVAFDLDAKVLRNLVSDQGTTDRPASSG